METVNSPKMAILVADGFEQSEIVKLKEGFEQAGVNVDIVSVDVPLESANPKDYDVLLLPGGMVNPDQFYTTYQAAEFIKGFFDVG